MTIKKALLIGCNYIKSNKYRLEGCINDVYQMKKVLLDNFEYKESDIILLTDNDIEPTYSNIMLNLKKLVELSKDLDEIYVHYSGHGTNIKDSNGDEPDGYDEGILPTDFTSNGIITDDVLYNNFFVTINSSCKVICVFDSCNSGSISDLTSSWLSDGNKYYKSILSTRPSLEKRVFILSGCVDDKLSYETIDPENNTKCGVMSLELRNLLKENNWILSVEDLIIGINLKLKKQKKIQTPVLTVGFDAEPNELVFINSKP